MPEFPFKRRKLKAVIGRPPIIPMPRIRGLRTVAQYMGLAAHRLAPGQSSPEGVTAGERHAALERKSSIPDLGWRWQNACRWG